ncbi:HotDog domain-containing protein [Aspergillus avenaceus]|uniref:HotDog domain-containing protein n=1 Tax=Aspergillus avenaceus TaxID=36643 RepID=A0A5N6TUP2_ASPAV|nr:HotDog domain-containing protein [Aspergillus avenaceus]
MFSPRRVPQLRLRNLATPSHRPPRSQTQFSRNTSTSTSTPPPPQPSKWPRRLLYTTIFGVLGIGAGKWMDDKISAPALPGTEEDLLKMEDVHRTYEHGLPIVKELRENPDYVEAEVYGNYSDEEKTGRLTSGPLRGSRGIALQKVFWNDKEKKAISVVFLGNGLEGWPTIVHGGALATVIDENLGRVAVRHLPQKTGVTANLEMKYRAPVFSGNFYTFHSEVDRERSTDRKAFVVGEVRDPVGRLCVQASALFVVPKTYKLKEIGEEY